MMLSDKASDFMAALLKNYMEWNSWNLPCPTQQCEPVQLSENCNLCSKQWHMTKISSPVLAHTLVCQNGVSLWCTSVKGKREISGLSGHILRLRRPGFFIPSSATGLHLQLTFLFCIMGKMILIWSIKDFEMHVWEALCKVGIIKYLLPFNADEHFPAQHHRKSSASISIWEGNISQMKEKIFFLTEVRSSSEQACWFFFPNWREEDNHS